MTGVQNNGPLVLIGWLHIRAFWSRDYILPGLPIWVRVGKFGDNPDPDGF